MWVLGMQTQGFMLMYQAPYQLSHQATSLRLSHNRCQSPILLASGREKAPYSHSMGPSCFHTHASHSLSIYMIPLGDKDHRAISNSAFTDPIFQMLNISLPQLAVQFSIALRPKLGASEYASQVP